MELTHCIKHHIHPFLLVITKKYLNIKYVTHNYYVCVRVYGSWVRKSVIVDRGSVAVQITGKVLILVLIICE